MARLIADDLFAGAGGWDVAADWLDIHARGVENMAEARATRDAAGLTTQHDDVWTFKPRYRVRWATAAEVALGAPASRLVLEAEGLIASPPCQTFSQAGKGSGRKALTDVLQVLQDVPNMTLPELREAGQAFGDERTALVLTPLWFALHHPYRWLAWEQVPTVLPVWEACAEVLRANGWHVWTGVLNAEQYGVPQTRKRAVLIANRDLEVTAPTPTHSRYYSRTPSKLDPGVAKWVSMAEALGWSPCEQVGFPRRADSADVVTIGGVAYRARDLRPATEPAQTVTEKARSWQRVHADDEPCTCSVTFTATNPRPNAAHRAPCTPAPTLAFGHERPRWNPRETTPDGLPRFAQQSDNVPDYTWPDNRPATTVAGRDLVQAPGATANRFNDSTKSRNDGVRVAVWEAAVLQSFPADHAWQGGKSKQYLQVGNAVPPLLAMAVLSAALGEPYVPPNLRGEPADLPHTHMAGAGRTAHKTAGQQPRRVDEPAHTITGAGSAYWFDHTTADPAQPALDLN